MEGTIRLNDGTGTSSASTRFAGGRLEECIGNQWLPLASSGFTMLNAHVVCTQMFGNATFASAVVDGSNL